MCQELKQRESELSHYKYTINTLYVYHCLMILGHFAKTLEHSSVIIIKYLSFIPR